ncbi:MAG TPA: histone deacetylase family protein [Syntrophales bacterium]|nr:histone deacetylase family protein [Syntrophales bacterium]HPQ43208.1 histone deacetylase family protein [Syntrophales bacterium]
MNVIYHEDFTEPYCSDPAAADGRIEAILRVMGDRVAYVDAIPADEEDILACHTKDHVEYVRRQGLYDIASLAAGGAIQAAFSGLTEPCFALIRPPGHHASANSAWGFCFFNNMAIAISKLKRENRIQRAFILDFDLHFGDGTVNILGNAAYATIYNPTESDANQYLKHVEEMLPDNADIIGISAGFDNHREDWGGVLSTDDYREMGRMVRNACRKSGGGCFAILEGGYNHRVLGQNVMALIEGLEE